MTNPPTRVAKNQDPDLPAGRDIGSYLDLGSWFLVL
jgi:hypothetical protein